MKIFLLVMCVLFLTLLAVNRQRIYVRDPIASVYKNDAKQDGAQVFISYSGDVLLWRDAEPRESRILVQSWNKMPGTPQRLTCLHWLVCLTDADHATIYPLDWSSYGTHHGTYDPKVLMSGGEVSYIDADGSRMRAELK